MIMLIADDNDDDDYNDGLVKPPDPNINNLLRCELLDFLADIHSLSIKLDDNGNWFCIFNQRENDGILPYPRVLYFGHWIYLELNPDGWLPYVYQEEDWGYCSVGETGVPSVEEAVIKAQRYILMMLVHQQLLPLLIQWKRDGKITEKERMNLINSYLIR